MHRTLLSRRSFVATAGAAGLVGASGLALPSYSRANQRPAFTHGVQSGDVDSASGMVWTRADRPARVTFEVATTESFANATKLPPLAALPETDFAVKRLLTGLASDQDIFYRMTLVDLSDVNGIRDVAEHCTQLPVHQRHPYAGELVYTAFSGSHQDAIKKGFEAQEKRNDPLFLVPYLPIDPKDVGRDYEAVIRINSQSGKGGMAYLLKADHGLDLPRTLQVEFSRIAQAKMDREGKELTSTDIWELFQRTYLLTGAPLTLVKQVMLPTSPDSREMVATLRKADGATLTLEGAGNGPIDALLKAINRITGTPLKVVDYRVRAVSQDMDALGEANIEIEHAGKRSRARAVSLDIVEASALAYLEVVNRVASRQLRDRLKPTDNVPTEVVPAS